MGTIDGNGTTNPLAGFDDVTIVANMPINPTVTINQAFSQVDPTSNSTVNFTAVFSESVTGFTDGDVTLSGTAGATTAVVTGSGSTYNIAVSGMTGSGTVVATIPAGVAQGSGGTNLASTSTDNTVTYSATGWTGLQNGGFESSSATPPDYWGRYTRTDTPVVTIQTASPPEGAQYAQVQIVAASNAGGLYQVATGFTSGSSYRITGSYRTNSISATVTIRCDTNGGTDYAAAEETIASTTSATWGTFSGDVTATGTSMTVFLDVETSSSGAGKAGAFDNIQITSLCDSAGTTDPSDATKAPGETATFTVTGSGSDPTYQWQVCTNGTCADEEDWSDVTTGTGGTTDTYTTPTLVAGDDGNKYRCVVSVACDSSTATSAAATLTVVSCVDVTVTSEPSSPTAVCAGATAQFSVVADGTEPINYQWKFSTDGGANWSDVADGTGGTTDTYTTAATTASMNGYKYKCVMTNCTSGSAETDGTATLTVNDVPSTPTAADATDVGDDTITWNWTAGSGATSYKLWDAATGGNQIGGTISNTYYVESGLDFNTEYSRWVEAINDCGASSRVALEATSTLRRDCVANNGFEAEFTNLPPKWELWDITTAGELSKLTSGAYAGSQAVGTPFPSTGSVYKGIYQQFNVTQGWYYNVQAYAKSTVSGGGQAWLGVNTDGSTTGGGNVAKTWPPGTSWSYRDALTGYGAAGNFAAQADVMTIILRSTRQTGSVGGTMYWDNVILSPAIKGLAGMPSDQSVCVGDAAPSFSVDADGAVGYQWEVNDGTGWVEVTDGSGATSATYTTATPTKDMDGWMYRCKVMGDGFSGCNGGTVWSSGATLTVKDATVVTGQPQHKSALLGAVDVQFSITATGEGSLSYQWQKFDGNWTALSDESGHISGAQTATLEIDNVVENDVGQYRCVVTGDCGSEESDPAELAIGPTIARWYSVKTHGTTHWAYELPVSGNGLIEPRRGDLVVRVEFSEAVMAVSESGIQVSDVTVMDSASNSVTPSAVKFVDGNRAEVASSDWLEITVAEGSADMRKLTVTLADGAVCRTTNTNAVVAGGRAHQVWCLIGDVNQSGVVSTTDIAKVRDQLKPPTNGVVSGTTFLNDVNLSGSINIVDMALVRGRDSNALPE